LLLLGFQLTQLMHNVTSHRPCGCASAGRAGVPRLAIPGNPGSGRLALAIRRRIYKKI
jgi:hypothetical protein